MKRIGATTSANNRCIGFEPPQTLTRGRWVPSLSRPLPDNQVMRKAIDVSSMHEKDGFRIMIPEVEGKKSLHIARVAGRIGRKGPDSVNVGYNSGLGKVIPDEILFATSYLLVPKRIGKAGVETPSAMASYQDQVKELYKSHYAALVSPDGKVIGMVNGATIRMNRKENLLFVGYCIVEKDFENKGFEQMLANGILEMSYLESAIMGRKKMPSYFFGEAEGREEIRLWRRMGVYPLEGVKYRQPELEVNYSDPKGLQRAREGIVFEKCAPFTPILGTVEGRTELGYGQVREAVEAVYRYYDLVGKSLGMFLERTFAGIREGAVWVLENGVFRLKQ